MLAMLRLRRRYTVFLVFAALLTLLVFRYQNSVSWSQHQHIAAANGPSTPNSGIHEGPVPPPSPPPKAAYEKPEEEEKPKNEKKPSDTNAEPALGKVETSSTNAPQLPSTTKPPTTTTTTLLDNKADSPKETLKDGGVKEDIHALPVVETTSTNPPQPPSTTTTTLLDKADSPKETIKDGGVKEDIHAVAPPGREDPPTFTSSPTPIRWVKQPEHFPVPTESIIQLPTGAPATIPRIQYAFKEEASNAKAVREKRQSQVKEEFKKAWSGYKTRAWMHDELSPVSGKFRDPFCGWAATLVDSLDTLWIMGLKDEFEEAAKAVDQIDFTISLRNEIPLFETTIRYLGGLLGAYDVSEHKYKNLLTRAEDLANILLGAFDTPNRMPMLFYPWKPAYASQPHRASAGSNLAELGSLSLEFTRLAQLTKEPRYYDAVARITEALAEFQNRTKLPGLFPPSVDASGCNKTVPATHNVSTAEQPKGYRPSDSELATDAAKEKKTSPDDLITDSKDAKPKDAKEPQDAKDSKYVKDSEDSKDAKESKAAKFSDSKGTGESLVEQKAKGLSKRDVAPRNVDSGSLPTNLQKAKHEIGVKLGDDWDCRKGGLESAIQSGSDLFSMGGNQDSTYEYFPKEYLLLGGRVDTYRQLYLNTIDTVRKQMLYRPMVPGNPNILFPGSLTTDGKPETKAVHVYHTEHLGCFIGGMVGIAAKIFDIDGDLDIAKRLTDGCVWAYSSMPLEVMPEGAVLMPCESMESCTWNETAYNYYLDPTGDERDRHVAEYIAKKAAETAEKAEKDEKDKDAAAVAAEALTDAAKAKAKDDAAEVLTDAAKAKSKDDAAAASQGDSGKPKDKTPDISNTTPSPVQKRAPPPRAAANDPQKPLSHKEYVEDKIRNNKLPSGYVSIRGKNYILRPEAIESVWYMYRLTGDPSWQDKGWKMFDAIIKATSVEYGHSAIIDVTSEKPNHADQMESFWLAETLKYFYLLFSTPDTISLDEWVLNTEAHAFKLGG